MVLTDPLFSDQIFAKFTLGIKKNSKFKRVSILWINLKIWWKSVKISVKWNHVRSKPYVMWRNLKIWWKSGKNRKNWINFRKGKSSYHIWQVNHPFCKEIWSKLLKSEGLRSAPLRKKKKKEIFKLLSFAHEVKS